jgi:hypothetical protein
MRATAPTNVSPAWRAPTWVAGKGQQPSFYLKSPGRLVPAITGWPPIRRLLAHDMPVGLTACKIVHGLTIETCALL